MPEEPAPARRTPATPSAGIGPSWLAWQTLTYSGAAQIKTAGAMHHAAEVRATATRYGRLVMAELLIEQGGEYAGAVRVLVAGVELGSIPRGIAAELSRRDHSAERNGPTCHLPR